MELFQINRQAIWPKEIGSRSVHSVPLGSSLLQSSRGQLVIMLRVTIILYGILPLEFPWKTAFSIATIAWTLLLKQMLKIGNLQSLSQSAAGPYSLPSTSTGNHSASEPDFGNLTKKISRPSSATTSIRSDFPLARVLSWARLFLTSSALSRQSRKALDKPFRSGRPVDPLNHVPVTIILLMIRVKTKGIWLLIHHSLDWVWFRTASVSLKVRILMKIKPWITSWNSNMLQDCRRFRSIACLYLSLLKYTMSTTDRRAWSSFRP